MRRTQKVDCRVRANNHILDWGAFVLGVLFVLCWVTAAYGNIPIPDTFVRSFTAQPVHAIAALYQGLFWAVIFGALGGALIALGFYLFRRHSQ